MVYFVWKFQFYHILKLFVENICLINTTMLLDNNYFAHAYNGIINTFKKCVDNASTLSFTSDTDI